MSSRFLWLAMPRMALLVAMLCPSLARGGGIALNGVGPVNRSMAGAATAAPIDAMGALHWNPASISGLDGSEVSFGLEFLLPTEELASSIPMPALSGADQGEPGVSLIPSIGWVHKEDGSPWTVGLGVYGIGGFRVNYPSSSLAGTANPILFPQAAGGLGRLFAEAEFVQVAPTLSYAFNERLSVGIAPTLTLGRVALDPLFTAAPVPGVGYTSGRGTRWAWGGGAQAGVYFIATPDLHLGASVKSPQWMEDFRVLTEGPGGEPRIAKYDLDYPLIVSLGASYSGIENLLLALDLRYFNYGGTDGFGDEGTFVDGALQGLDWSSIFCLSFGAQLRLTECLYLRSGYGYQQNPIAGSDTFVNVASPLIVEHVVSVGATYRIFEAVHLAATYVHGFENSSTGPTPTGGAVTSTISADSWSLGATIKY